MPHDTVEQIKQNIRELDKQIEQSRADRVAQGLPADPPPSFVSLPMAWTIYKRLSSFIQYAVQYANVCDQSNEIIEISDEQAEWIKTHELDVLFVNKARNDLGLISLGIEGIYEVLSGYDEYETAGELLRDLVRYITFTRPVYSREHDVNSFVYDTRLTNKENEQAYSEVDEEIERLKDDGYFQQEYDKLVEHYESIKHLY